MLYTSLWRCDLTLFDDKIVAYLNGIDSDREHSINRLRTAHCTYRTLHGEVQLRSST